MFSSAVNLKKNEAYTKYVLLIPSKMKKDHSAPASIPAKKMSSQTQHDSSLLNKWIS